LRGGDGVVDGPVAFTEGLAAGFDPDAGLDDEAAVLVAVLADFASAAFVASGFAEPDFGTDEDAVPGFAVSVLAFSGAEPLPFVALSLGVLSAMDFSTPLPR